MILPSLAVFWVVTLCSLVGCYQNFGLTFVIIYKLTCHQNPEDHSPSQLLWGLKISAILPRVLYDSESLSFAVSVEHKVQHDHNLFSTLQIVIKQNIQHTNEQFLLFSRTNHSNSVMEVYSAHGSSVTEQTNQEHKMA